LTYLLPPLDLGPSPTVRSRFSERIFHVRRNGYFETGIARNHSESGRYESVSRGTGATRRCDETARTRNEKICRSQK
jgi:hypothetical protein